jgi:hypothetical protein
VKAKAKVKVRRSVGRPELSKVLLDLSKDQRSVSQEKVKVRRSFPRPVKVRVKVGRSVSSEKVKV